MEGLRECTAQLRKKRCQDVLWTFSEQFYLRQREKERKSKQMCGAVRCSEFPLISIYKPPAITCWTQNDEKKS